MSDILASLSPSESLKKILVSVSPAQENFKSLSTSESLVLGILLERVLCFAELLSYPLIFSLPGLTVILAHVPKQYHSFTISILVDQRHELHEECLDLLPRTHPEKCLINISYESSVLLNCNSL